MHADFCKFMGNEKRIEILFLLDTNELCVEELAFKMDLRISNVSQHLAVLREKGIVETRRQGTKIYYKLSNPKTLEACIMMRDVMISNMNIMLGKLKN